MYLPQSLGYGTYEFEIVGDVTAVDTQLVGAVFLYEDDTHEIDVEFSRWGYEENENVQFVVQPFDVAGKNNFASGQERVHINFWQYKGMKPSDSLGHEFMVKKFMFTPQKEKGIEGDSAGDEICALVKNQKGKVVEKGFFSMLAGKLKGYFR